MNEELDLHDRVRLRAALAVLEELNTVLDEHPGWVRSTLEEQCKLSRKLNDLKHKAQRELLRSWRKGE